MKKPGKKSINGSRQPPSTQGIICPICGKSLNKNVPTKSEIIDDELYDGEIRIINSRITIKYQFDHYYDEEENMTMEKPHQLTVFIGAAFDSTGVCTVFDILEIRPGEE